MTSEVYVPASTKCIEVVDSYFYNDIHIDLKSNYILNGYWQSEEYFIEKILLEKLSPSDEVLERLRNTPLINTNTISIHIRRTDYVTSGGFHPVQSLQYYESAIKEIGDYDYLFVFF
jgi:hypothetical protein